METLLRLASAFTLARIGQDIPLSFQFDTVFWATPNAAATSWFVPRASIISASVMAIN